MVQMQTELAFSTISSMSHQNVFFCIFSQEYWILVRHSRTCQDFAFLCYVLKYTRNNSANKIHLYHSVWKITKIVSFHTKNNISSVFSILQTLKSHQMRHFEGFSNTVTFLKYLQKV